MIKVEHLSRSFGAAPDALVSVGAWRFSMIEV
jgi:hypothetical protein